MQTVSLRRVLLAALLASLFPVCAFAQPLARETARFTDRLDAEVPHDAWGRGAWSAMDTLVLAALNGGVAAEGLDTVFSRLPGYSPPQPAEGFQVGRTAFYSQLPREAPNYWAGPVRLGGRTLVLGIYSLTYSAPGRLSVYGQSGGRWRRVSHADAGNPVSAYFLPLGDTARGLVMVANHIGGDHSAAHVKLWRLTPSGLRLQRAIPHRFMDAVVEATDTTVSVAYDSLPPRIAGAILGPRLAFRTTFRVREGRIVSTTEALNPWVHTVDRFYDHLARGRRTLARQLVADDATFRALAAAPEASAEAEDGDAALGDGWVRMWTDAKRFLVSVRRGGDGAWRIVSVSDNVQPEP
ncbi:MAG TPA: hypothetical protein VHG91_13115 [Longimicrobium sp.]|nr:hypothetical protein [Longimicrobium sp.]